MRARIKSRPVVAIAALAAVTLACTAATAGAATGRSAASGAGRPADSCVTWQTVAAPNPPGLTSPPSQDSTALITSVNVLSSRDVWFTGGDFTPPVSWGPWMLHWNGRSVGTSRQVSEVTSAGSDFSSSEPGSFDSGSDGWILMVGQNLDQFDPDIATAEHWSGGRWTLTPMAVSPDPVHKGIRFNDVAAASPDQAWAVGAFYAIGPGHLFGVTAVGALIEHWDGAAWSIVPNPAQDQPGAVLTGISVVSPDDVWAVGQQGNPTQSTYAGDTPFIEHWNGSAWAVVPAPAAGQPSVLEAVSADSATDAWAVGYQTEAGTSTLVPLAEHWNGTAWRVAALPGGGKGLNGLASVYAAAPNDVWASEGGPQYPDSPGSSPPTVFLHWNGTVWSTVPEPVSPAYGLGYEYTSIDGSGPGDVWAAGTVVTGYPSGNQYPLIARLSCSQAGRR
jgi:hypothetical protein